MDTLIILCAKYLIYLVVLAGIVLAWRAERYRGLIILALSVGVAVAVGKLLGLVWYDPLPFVQGNFTPLFPHDANNGFPSDHTLIAAAVAAAVAFWHRWWGLCLMILAIVVGAARVLAGVHHVVDIVAALIIAALCAAFVHSVARRFERPSQNLQ